MADGTDFSDILRRTVQANARFYKGWVDLSLDYWRGIGEIFGVQAPAVPGAQEPPDASGADAGRGVLVLEGDGGTSARGAFLVTNDLGRTVECELVASDVTGTRGSKARAAMRFEPARFQLEPGAQRVVQATIPVGDELEAGVAYNGQVSIRGLEGFAVPFVVRRTHRVEEPGQGGVEPSGKVPRDTPRPPGGRDPSKKQSGRGASQQTRRRARQKE